MLFGAAGISGGLKGKSGAIPARSRHCNKEYAA